MLVANNNPYPDRGYGKWVSIGGAVTSLEGLQNCKNLTDLYLESGGITDLRPLTQLSPYGKLQFLDLDYNNTLSDLSPLSTLTSLTGLEIRSGIAEGDFNAGLLTDLGPVSALVNLQLLELSGQPVTSLAPLANLSQLQELWIYGDSSAKENAGFTGGITVLSGLTDLQLFEAGSRGITEISSLSGSVSLATVDLNNNPLTDISPMSGWHHGQSVILEYTNLSGAIPPLPGLGTNSSPLTLDLANTGISDISNLINSIPAGFHTPGSVLNITGDSSIPVSQIHALQTAVPTLTITGP